MSPPPHRIRNLSALKNLDVVAALVGGKCCFQANWPASEDGEFLFHKITDTAVSIFRRASLRSCDGAIASGVRTLAAWPVATVLSTPVAFEQSAPKV